MTKPNVFLFSSSCAPGQLGSADPVGGVGADTGDRGQQGHRGLSPGLSDPHCHLLLLQDPHRSHHPRTGY